MKLTVLTDNHTTIDRYYLGEPAVSYYLEDGDRRILLDTGYSDVYAKNAAALGIDLTQVDAIVLSHSHNDHTGGLRHFPVQDGSVALYAHPEVFAPRRCDGLDVGSPMTLEEAAARFDLHLTRTPEAVSDHLTFLGEIPRISAFESRHPVGERLTPEGWVPDFLPDDSALVYRGPEAISLITGCSHSGVCNLLAQAKAVTGCRRIQGLIGGLHLFDEDVEQTEKTAEFLAIEGVRQLYPCHCTSFAARVILNRKLPVQEVGVGLTITF